MRPDSREATPHYKVHFNPRSWLEEVEVEEEEIEVEDGEAEDSLGQVVDLEESIKKNHIQNLRVKGGEVEVAVKKDGLTNQGSNVSTIGEFGHYENECKKNKYK